MTKILSVFNLFSVILTIAVNYYAQNAELNGNTVGSLSAEYYNLFTPASYAFIIWLVIYGGLIAYAVFQVYMAFKKDNYTWVIDKTGPWFVAANLANSCWIFAWLYEYTGLSVFIIVLLLFFLIKVILNTNMERWNAPLRIIAFTWWPICLYSGWVTVAAFANIAAYLAKIEWDPPFFNEIQWTMLMIIIVTIVNIVMIYLRNMREFAAVGIWGLVAIYFRHFDVYPVLSYTALIGAVAIFSNLVYHAWINRETNPLYKLLKKK